MTPKEKAQQILGKFNNELIEDTFVIYQNVDESKRCALIAVDLILIAVEDKYDKYWQEVKQEIELI
jgi:hypothetical protein